MVEGGKGGGGIIEIVDPEESELAQQLAIDDDHHTGFVTLDEVKGMYAKKEGNIGKIGHSINASGPWKVEHMYSEKPERLNNSKTKQKEEMFWIYQRDKETGAVEMDKETGSHKRKPVFKSDCAEYKEEDFILDKEGKRTKRMTQIKEHYRFKIKGDTTGYSSYQGGGTLTQHFNPSVHHHRSLKECLQQPIHPGQAELLQVDGAKDNTLNQNKLHLAKQAVFKYVEGSKSRRVIIPMQ